LVHFNEPQKMNLRNYCLLKNGLVFGQFSQTFCLIDLTFFLQNRGIFITIYVTIMPLNVIPFWSLQFPIINAHLINMTMMQA
jgi:hypothetical protein